MIRRFATVTLAAAGICLALPAGADQVGIGVGPGGVGERSAPVTATRRDREVIRERQ